MNKEKELLTVNINYLFLFLKESNTLEYNHVQF